MPQKRNPDSLELIRAKANIIRTKGMEFSNIISGLPLTYFKDFQEDKKIIFESYDELMTCLKVMTDVIKKSEFEKKQGLKICNEFFATATDLADYLVIKKSIPFRNSYKIIAQIVSYAQKNKKNLSEVSLKEFQLFEKSITKDIYEYIDVEKSLYRKKTKMSTNPKLVSQKINRYSKLLK
jgi:argininosuccinate lyase